MQVFCGVSSLHVISFGCLLIMQYKRCIICLLIHLIFVFFFLEGFGYGPELSSSAILLEYRVHFCVTLWAQAFTFAFERIESSVQILFSKFNFVSSWLWSSCVTLFCLPWSIAFLLLEIKWLWHILLDTELFTRFWYGEDCKVQGG